VKLSREEVEKLVEALKERGAVEEEAPKHAKYKFRLGNALLTVYDGGSLLYGGKEKEREELKGFVAELLARGKELPAAGCDEAGKGEFVGPLVVACVVALEPQQLKKLIELGVKDSKGLNKEKLLELAEKVKSCCRGLVKVVSPEKYNELYEKFKNQNRLLDHLYSELLKEVCRKFKPKRVVVDMYSKGAEKELKKVVNGAELIVEPKAERDPLVAAASVVAKAERLKAMEKLKGKFGLELPEGNVKLKELLRKVPKELHGKVFKTHFNVGGKS